MRNIKLVTQRRGCEVLIMTLTGEKDNGDKVSKDLNFSGNVSRAAAWGAQTVVNALMEMENEHFRVPSGDVGRDTIQPAENKGDVPTPGTCC